MRQKIGTSIDNVIIEKAKIFAIKQRKSLSDIIEEALKNYLSDKGIEFKSEKEKRIYSLKEILSTDAGSLTSLAKLGKGSGDFDERDFD